MAKVKTHTAVVVDESTLFTFQEICEVSGIESELIIELIEHGVIEPINTPHNEWQFTAISLHRSQQAQRLKNDLGINLPGVALILDLLDELHELRNRLHIHDQAV